MVDTIYGVNKEVSIELGLPENVVKSINAYYWKGIRDCISSGVNTGIWVKGIGTFVISRNKLRTEIYKLIRQIRKYRLSSREFRKVSKEESIASKYMQLRLMLQRRNDIAIVYKEKEDRIRAKKLNNVRNNKID